MPVIVKETFTGYSAPPTSGDAPFTATDNTEQVIFIDYFGSPTTGDKVEFTLTFPTGTVTFRARWSSTTTLVLERVSTIPGTNNGTATLRTFTGTSTNKPRTDGDLVRMGFTVNRGVVNALTAITFKWHGRSSFATAATTDTFNVDGELTPTAGSFAITGSSFRNRLDLLGRVPDGGGDPSLQVGTWAKAIGDFAQDGSRVTDHHPSIGLTAEGIGEPLRSAVGNIASRVVDGAGINSGNMTVRAIAECSPGLFPALELLARWDAAARSGLVATLFYPDLVAIGSYTAGVYDGDYDLESITGIDDGTPHEFEFVVDTDTFTAQAFVDGVAVFTTPIDISVGAGAAVTSGTGGLGAYRDGRGTGGLEITDWEIDSDAITPPGPPACDTAVASYDEFTGLSGDIDNRVPDQAPGNGQWIEHPSSAAGIEAEAGFATLVGPDRAVYRDTAIPDLENDYCVQVDVRFPPNDSPGTGTEPFFEEWRYQVMDSYGFGGTVLVDGLVADILGTNTIAGLAISNLTVHPNGQPAGFQIENTQPPESTRTIRFYVTSHPATASVVPWTLQATWSVMVEPTVIPISHPPFFLFGNDGIGFRVNDIPPPAPALIPVGPQNLYPDHPYPPFYYPMGDTNVTESRTVSLGMAGGSGVVAFAVLTSDGSGKYDLVFDEITVNLEVPGSGTPGTHIGEYAYVEALARWDGLVETGFGARLIFDHTGGSIDSEVELAEYDAGVRTVVRTYPAFVAHTVDTSLVLRAITVDGATVLVVVLDNTILGVFEVATDTPTVGDHLTGDPGLAALDDSGTGSFMEIERYKVYGPSTTPCEGPPDNPYPPDPPPQPPILPFYVMKNKAWREEFVETTFPRKNLAHRALSSLGMRKNLAFRYISEDGDFENEPETPLPPHHDPCYIFPPIDPGPVDPMTSRFFGPSSLPLGALGGVFNGTQKAIGNWYFQDLPFAQSRASILVGAQGGSARTRLNGTTWNLNYWIDATIDILAPLYSLLLDYPDTFLGYSCADDLESERLWNTPGGVPMGELLVGIGTVKAQFPGIRIGLRCRPDHTDGIDIGADFYSAQYVSQTGSAFSFGASNYSIAASRGALIILDCNLLHGGNGSSGFRHSNGTIKGQSQNNWEMSPAEVVAYYTAMIDGAASVDASLANYAGSKGYQYDATFLARPSMMDAMVTVHNYIAALPPLP